jgi:hypothetical protein
VNVDTGQFAALTDQIAAIEAEVAELQRTMALSELSLDAIENSAYRRATKASSVPGPSPGPRALATFAP